ncbi:hypothetical protein [Rathayibacter sp. VKM Ac-2760]|uniref:hypothetical protein n=1 Tax=Rathayibacter sp. VKM Ac-2760 TaxID=2609253 RepID=UPI001317E8CB|nr:hypothetical protein [Rathayibacter sp. VKM Ac-2760]QHC58852.1 hypothetical protein GSU72_10055 [Rathayibacter sp. VKM Ac-2760]
MTRQPRLFAALALAGGLALASTGCSSQGAPQTVPATAPATVSAVSVGSVTTDGTTILALTTLGDDVFVLGQRGDEIRSAASFDGGDPDLNWESFGAPAAVDAAAFTVVNPGNFPDAAPGGIATVTGRAGSDITGIDVETGAGATVAATLQDGYWIAAWEGGDFDGGDTPDPSFTAHLADGGTTTVSFADATKE